MAQEKRFDIVVVGDCVMDCISYVDRMPIVGETYFAHSYIALPGGKGANACIASSRLGSQNAFICKLGDDTFGREFLRLLKEDNLSIDDVSISKTDPTSVASIIVDKNGKNIVVVSLGATLELNEADLDRAEPTIQASRILITSMMVRGTTALHALKLGKRNNLITIFNFAPALQDLDPEFNKYVDLLVVNEIEAEVFTGGVVKKIEDAKVACKSVLAREGFYIGVCVTLGEQGCVYGDKKTGEIRHFSAREVNVVDSIGAGDAFVGSLAHYINKLGVENISQAIPLACEYASLSVQKKGTQNSYLRIDELDAKFRVTQ